MSKCCSHMIQLIFPHIQDILDETCEEAKNEMRTLPNSELGSWEQAVTTSD